MNSKDYSYCVGVTPLDNCLSLDWDGVYADCEDCDVGYYLEDGRCHEHSEVENCLEYLSDEDGCECCDPGYYVNEYGSSCIDTVSGGVMNCCLYST